jgi:hypothetical protein
MQAYISKLFCRTGSAGLTVFLLHSILMLGLSSCQKDEVAERGYPLPRTLDVKEITQTGAKFSATIISGNPSEVVEYGFVWSELSDRPRLGNNDNIDITGSLNSSTFSSEVQNLNSGKVYHVRSFIKTSTLLIYGRVVAFGTLK